MTAKTLFTAGSLHYTRGGLVRLFAWLIWGDFIMAIMTHVEPALLPLMLKSHHTSNSQMVLIVSTLALVMNATLNPVISYNSDRFRSSWGRRRPFIVASTPFVVLFLGAVPFAPEILSWLNAHGILAKTAAASSWPPLILVVAILVAGYQIGHMLVSTVYYYLVPDVVPPALLGRFYGLFRLASNAALFIFNYFIFGLAEAHMKLIFVTAALSYGVFILLMCWRVKEGAYPPPAKEDHAHWWSGVRNYARECFGHSYYWWVFLVMGALAWSGLSTIFAVFFFRDEMGLSLDQVGKMTAWGNVTLFICVYPLGVLVDRWGSHRSLILAAGANVVLSVLMFFFIHPGPGVLIWYLLRAVPAALHAVAAAKWTVAVFPKERYGQFASAAALFGSLGGMALGPLCGRWMDWIKHYQYFLLWSAFFSLIAMAGTMVVYRKWKALGGPDAYQAP